MKRLVCLFLILALTLSLFSCGASLEDAVIEETAATAPETAGTATAETAGLHDATGFAAGFSRKVITPKTPVPLAGYGRTSQRFHKNVLDDITVSVVAVSDGEAKALIITQDIIRCDNALTMQARKNISKKTGVPVENILVSATHTHSSIDPNNSDSSVDLWKSIYYKQILAASQEALADLDSAELEIGRIQTRDLTYVRRYYLKDGTLLGDNSGTEATAENPIVSHEAPGDEELQLIRFVRKNQPDILLANFQGHPTKTGGSSKFNMSADYIYPFRKTLEEEYGVRCAFFLGSSGNMNTTSRMSTETSYGDYMYYGKLLAGFASDALKNMEKAETGKILVKNAYYTATVNKEVDPTKLQVAQEINILWNDMKTSEAKALCRQYGISSPYAAGSMLTRQNLPDTVDMECCAVSFGDVSFITAGYEMFSTIQLYMKERTPFKMTFFLTCSQEKNGYIPTADVFPNGGYEVDTCRYVAGTAEGLRDTYMEMLNTLASER